MEISATNPTGAGKLKIGFAIEPDSIIKDLDDVKKKLEEIDNLIDEINRKKDIQVGTKAGGKEPPFIPKGQYDEEYLKEIRKKLGKRIGDWRGVTIKALSEALFTPKEGGLSHFDVMVSRIISAKSPAKEKYLGLSIVKRFRDIVLTRAAGPDAETEIGQLFESDELKILLRMILRSGEAGHLPLLYEGTPIESALKGLMKRFPEKSRELRRGQLAAIKKDIEKRFPKMKYKIIEQLPLYQGEDERAYAVDYVVFVKTNKGIIPIAYEAKITATEKGLAQAKVYEIAAGFTRESASKIIEAAKRWVKEGGRKKEGKFLLEIGEEELAKSLEKMKVKLMAPFIKKTEVFKKFQEQMGIEFIQAPVIIKLEELIDDIKEIMGEILKKQNKSDEEIKTILEGVEAEIINMSDEVSKGSSKEILGD
ncbi:MAG: hypothetical protein ACXQS8_06790 [Candidatus Helarchaeales archaeon]